MSDAVRLYHVFSLSPGGCWDPLSVALNPNGCPCQKWALDGLDRAGRRWQLAFVSHSLAAVKAISMQGLAVIVVKASTFPRSLVLLGREHGLPSSRWADSRLHRSSTLSEADIRLADPSCCPPVENLTGGQ